MTLQQEINLAAERAYEEGYKKASEAASEAYEKTIFENARKFKEARVSAEIISKCTGLSPEQVEKL